MQRRKLFVGLVGAAVLLSGSTTALADLHLTVVGGSSGSIWESFSPPGLTDPGGGNGNYGNGAMGDGSFSFSALWDNDPFINLSTSFLNTTGISQVFTFSASIPVFTPLLGSNVMGGALSGGTTDSDGNATGGISAPAGGSLYTAFVDGVSVATLVSDPFSLGFASAGESVTFPDTSFGLSTGFPDAPGPVVLSSIGIEFTVFVAAGDSMTMAGSFVILPPIPAPGALALLGVAGLACGRRRRR